MDTFESLKLLSQLNNAIEDLGFDKPTPIQTKAYPVILSGKDVVGIAQTGTGKTLAYMLPILQTLKFSKQVTPRVLIMVPTRELVLQLVEQIENYGKYINVRALGVYGGTNINNQMRNLAQGTDILVATPGRLYDLIISRAVLLKDVKKLVIDEVDVMLDLGFRFQLTNIFDLLPDRRQNIMFSATMTEEVDALIDDYFVVPEKISIAVSGTPLENIEQQCYSVRNFNTKLNLLRHLIQNKEDFRKILVFVSTKRIADRLFEKLQETNGSETCVLHSNKAQNYRIRSIQEFDEGTKRILVSTDVMARGLDIDKITHVINYDTPNYPENYMHRIGRTGRAEQAGKSILFYTEKEEDAKEAVEKLMGLKIQMMDFPEEVQVSRTLTDEENPKDEGQSNPHKHKEPEEKGDAFHEKKLKNTKTNQGGSYLRKMKTYKKPRTRGDKGVNNRKKR